MKLRDYLELLNDFVKENPESLDLDLIYKDDFCYYDVKKRIAENIDIRLGNFNKKTEFTFKESIIEKDLNINSIYIELY